MSEPTSPIVRLTRAYRHLERLTELIRIMVKFGFGDVFDLLGLGDLLAKARKLAGLAAIDIQATRPRRLRLALQEMGLVFVKLGQYLSTRQDILAENYLDELSLLQDAVPPLPGSEISEIISSQLNQGCLINISPEPLAAASIGQVHSAELSEDKREVVVKIRRPGLQKQIDTDLEILAFIADLVEKHLLFLDYVHASDLVNEFKRNLTSELNFRLEAVNIERFGRLYANDPQVKIPKVFKSLCTTDILVMERVGGLKADDVEGLKVMGISPSEVASIFSRVALEQMMEIGLFHADPHPGNILVQSGPKLAFMDFGLVGALDRRSRESLLSLAVGVVTLNETKAARAVLRLTIHPDNVDFEALEREVGLFMETHLSGSLGEIRLGDLLKDVLELMSQHNLRAPQNLLLLIKALVQYESLGLRLDPDFKVVEVAGPQIATIYRKRFSPLYWFDSSVRGALVAADTVENLPSDFKNLFRTLKSGRLPADLTIKDLDRLGRSITEAGYRLSFALVLASLVIGSAVVIHSKVPPLWRGFPVLGLVGFLGAGLVGFWLLVDFLRK
jgi:ubiquinone biosynthesis protein